MKPKTTGPRPLGSVMLGGSRVRVDGGKMRDLARVLEADEGDFEFLREEDWPQPWDDGLEDGWHAMEFNLDERNCWIGSERWYLGTVERLRSTCWQWSRPPGLKPGTYSTVVFTGSCTTNYGPAGPYFINSTTNQDYGSTDSTSLSNKLWDGICSICPVFRIEKHGTNFIWGLLRYGGPSSLCWQCPYQSQPLSSPLLITLKPFGPQRPPNCPQSPLSLPQNLTVKLETEDPFVLVCDQNDGAQSQW